MGCLITYQKENGDILIRPRVSQYDLYIGKETSMGWKVLDIHYQFQDGNYYHKEDYERMMKEYHAKKDPIKKQIADYLVKKTYSWRQI